MQVYARTLMVLLLAASSHGANSQTFPSKPVRLVVPYPPGGNVDIVGRLLVPKMSEALGQPVVVDYRAGANGAIGSEHVARAAPDGYTIIIGNSATHVTSQLLTKNLPFDPIRDFTPIAAAVEPVTFLLMNPTVPANNLRELIEHVRRNPGKVAFGSIGIGSNLHLTGELINKFAGIEMVHVPYKGLAQAVTDTIAGQVQITFSSPSASIGFMKAGKLRVMAVVTATRYPGLPDVPAAGEIIPGFENPSGWFGYFGPAKLPGPVLARLNNAIVGALSAADVRGKLDEGGMTVIANTPEEFAVFQRKSFEIYARAIQAAGLKPE